MELAKQSLTPFIDNLYNHGNKLIKQVPEKKALSLTVAATVTFVAWKVIKRLNDKRATSFTPPLVKGGTPFVGNLLQMQKDPMKFLSDAKETYGPCFSMDMPGYGRLVVVTGPLISEVMKQTKAFNFTEGIEKIVPTLKVIDASYDHKFHREEISPREKNPIIYPIKHNFKEDQIDVFSGRIQEGFKRGLEKHMDIKKGEEKAVDIKDVLTSIISYISCPCFAGSNVGKDEELIDAMAVFTQKIIKAGVFLTLLPSWLGNFVVQRFFSVEYEIDLIMKLLVPELRKIRNGERGDNYEPSFATMVLNLPKMDGSPRSVESSAYLFSNIALASIHTTSHFSTFAFHELACRPTLMQDLRNELATLDGEYTPESVAKLPLMDSFFREVLRFNADYLGLHHLAMQDTTLSTGHVVPKGTMVIGAVQQIHNDPQYAPVDADTGEAIVGNSPLDEFDAYRYVGKNIKATSVGLGHLSFGLGAHACPGRFFASNEIKYVIAEMITKYNIRTKSGKRAKDTVLLGMTRFPPSEPLLFEAL